MNTRRAVRILMLSPIYFRLSVSQRRELVAEYCRLFNSNGSLPANSYPPLST